MSYRLKGRMLSALQAKIRPVNLFYLVLLLAGLTVPTLGLLRAQDNSGGPPPPPPSDAGAAAQAQGTPAPDQNAPAPDQGQSFTSDDPTGVTQGNASFQTFYDALSSQGSWVQSSDYGYVWQPQVNDSNWAPYTDGYWAYTDDGWTWVSNEQFGWATYHYGRWVNLDDYGWVWVPGYTWAPAWVSWRYGDGYVGWAPLPPDSFSGVDYEDDSDYSDDFGYHIGGDCDDFYGIGAGLYIFLPVNFLGHHDYHRYYRNRYDNWHLIGHTANVTNINVTRSHGTGNAFSSGQFHHVTAGGPKLAEVNAVSPTPIQKVTLTHTSQRGGGAIDGNLLALYAPRVRPYVTGSARPQPADVAGAIGQAKINRGANILNPLAVNSHLAPSPATEAQVQQARIAESQMPSTAKVLTDESSVRPVLQQPLTAMRPVGTPRSVTPIERSTPAPATPQAYAPARVYPQAGGNEEAPAHATTPGTVYQPAPVYPSRTAPSETPAESHTYSPAPVYPTNPSGEPRSAPSEAGVGRAETPTYVRPAAPTYAAPSAPEYHPSSAPASSEGESEGSRAAASSSGGTPATSGAVSSGSYSSGGSSGGGASSSGRSR